MSDIREFKPRRRTVKVLTVQYDVTHLSEATLNELRYALEVQGEDVVTPDGECHQSPLLNSSIREIDTE